VLATVYLVMWRSGAHLVRTSGEFEETSASWVGHANRVASTLTIGDWFVLLLFTVFSTISVVGALGLVL
jgi:hypothetical protein